ncbi:hypothetical protein ACFOHS_13515 [Jhaorihella thermophila]
MRLWGEIAGWERANWFARDGQEREYHYAWGRQNFFDNVAEELAAVRSNIGMYDMSSFGKLRVEGPDAEAFLNHVCGADMSVPVGKIVYTQFLNPPWRDRGRRDRDPAFGDRLAGGDARRDAAGR